MIVNAGFYRTIKKGKKKVIQNKNVTGIEVPGDWETAGQNTKFMFYELMKHKPEGDGWCIQSWTLVEDGDGEINVKIKAKRKKL